MSKDTLEDIQIEIFAETNGGEIPSRRPDNSLPVLSEEYYSLFQEHWQIERKLEKAANKYKGKLFMTASNPKAVKSKHCSYGFPKQKLADEFDDEMGKVLSRDEEVDKLLTALGNQSECGFEIILSDGLTIMCKFSQFFIGTYHFEFYGQKGLFNSTGYRSEFRQGCPANLEEILTSAKKLAEKAHKDF